MSNILNKISSDIIKASITVHNELGPGLLESVYQKCLSLELNKMGYHVKTEAPVKIYFKNQYITDDGLSLNYSCVGFAVATRQQNKAMCRPLTGMYFVLQVAVNEVDTVKPAHLW